jgi:hypothetical protein
MCYKYRITLQVQEDKAVCSKKEGWLVKHESAMQASTKEDEQENNMEEVKEDSTIHTIKLCQLVTKFQIIFITKHIKSNLPTQGMPLN